MKAEHRKELHTNVLAKSINQLVGGLKSKPSHRTITLWVFLLLAVGLFFGWRYFSHRSMVNRSALWLKLDEAASPSDLERLAEDNRGTMPARIARFQVARVKLQHGLENLLSPVSRKLALEEVGQARDEYQRLAEECKDLPFLAQEAMMGTAKAKESLGDLDAALADYQKLAQAFPDSVLGKEASKRAEKLQQKRSQVQALYKELERAADPKAKP